MRDTRGGKVGIVAHAAFETYSVLTRPPEPHAISAEVERRYDDAANSGLEEE